MEVSLRSIIVFSVLLGLAIGGKNGKVKCYSCITPWNGANFDQLCSDNTVCEGTWCTKGPDGRSTGILHGCSEFVPLDRAASDCKAVNQSGSLYYNCYCNNIDFCNSSAVLNFFPIFVIVALFLIKH